MKAGHSNLLGHMVDAASVPQRGCADLQIVCPICREPVYKSGRQDGERSLDYLAHFPNTKADVSQCELRVSRMMADRAPDEDEIRGRRENLKFFLAVLTQMIDEALSNLNGEAASKYMGVIRRSRMVLGCSDMSKKTNREVVEQGQLLMPDARDDMKTLEVAHLMTGRKLGLDLNRQRAYAHDFLRTLLTPQCTTAYRHLYQKAWYASLTYFVKVYEQHPDELHFDNAFHCGLGMAYDGEVNDRHTMAMMYDEAAQGEMLDTAGALTLRILMTLDYAGWLRRRLENPSLQRVRWMPDRIVEAKPKRKPRPKRTHRR